LPVAAGVVGIIGRMNSEGPRERPAHDPLFGRGTLIALFAWGLVVLAFSVGGLADVTRFWWLVPLFGTAAPVALVAARGWAAGRAAVDAGRAERELLCALREYGELTPTAAAMLTPLTAAEAAKALERLAREGHIEAGIRDGAVAFALREGDRLMLSDQPSEAASEDGPPTPTPPEPLEEPLSERELAVLALLADGRTNKEISQVLFIAQGTVKAHVASVYRKLGVHSRAEAVSRAGALDLLA
jgi:DNA-binding CsgD family transcriptional regulator